VDFEPREEREAFDPRDDAEPVTKQLNAHAAQSVASW